MAENGDIVDLSPQPLWGIMIISLRYFEHIESLFKLFYILEVTGNAAAGGPGRIKKKAGLT